MERQRDYCRFFKRSSLEKIILDTNILIEILKGDGRTLELLRSLKYSFAVSAVSEMELYFGAINKAELLHLQKFIRNFEIIQIDQSISRQSTELIFIYAKSHHLNIPDSLIAATGMSTGYALLTYNQKDFRYINDLSLIKLPK